MKSIWLGPLAVLLVLFMTACDGSPLEIDNRHSATEWAIELPPPERFDWTDQPIQFSPPPPEWERQKETSAGHFGVRFVKYEQGGQSIQITEFKRIGDRDKCRELLELAESIESVGRHGFIKALSRARPHLGTQSISLSEKDAFASANERLTEAQAAFARRDRDAARDAIESALWHLQRVEFELEDVLPQALFTGEKHRRVGKVELGESRETRVAGLPAHVLDYTIDPRDRDGMITGRQVYVEHNNRLFVATFQGVDQYLPLFEAMVASISFPDAVCQHGPAAIETAEALSSVPRR